MLLLRGNGLQAKANPLNVWVCMCVQEAVKACLARVAAGEAPRMLAAAWEQHEGTMCRGVRWDRHELEELQVVAECVGGRQLAAVCRLLAIDHGGWSGG